MVANRLEIELKLNDRATQKLGTAQKKIQSFTSRTKKDFVAMAAKIWLAQQAFLDKYLHK